MKALADFKNFTANEIVLLILAVSAFISVYAIGITAVALAIYIVATRQFSVFTECKLETALLVAFWLISMITSLIYGQKIDILIGIAVLFAGVVLKFITYAMTKRVFHAMLAVFCIMSIMCFIVAVCQKIIIVNTEHGARFSSTFTNPNIYSTVIETVVLVAMYCYMVSGSKKEKMFYVIVLLLNIIGLYLCQSRMAFIAVVLSLPIMLSVLNKRLLVSYILTAVIVFTAIVLLFKDFLPRISDIAKDFQLRWEIWENAVKEFKQHPIFGQGYLPYWRIYSDYAVNGHKHAHNLLLEMLMSFGIVGTGLAVSFFAINIVKLYRLYKKNVCHHRFTLAIALLFAILIHGLTDITIFWPQTGALVSIILLYSSSYEPEACLDA